MKVARWGNSLAVRLPAELIEALHLNEGDEIRLVMKDAGTFIVERMDDPAELLERLRKFRGKLPKDFTFDRDDANRR